MGVTEVQAWQAQAEGWEAAEVVRWALAQFGRKISLASSFGAEDVVLLDLASRSGLPFRVFTLDTDFLFPETYDLISRMEATHGISIERARASLTPEAQAGQHGESLWARDPRLCCEIRKVQPLTRTLRELDAWVTGIRRDQTPDRANAKKVEWDERFGLVKINPLADWTAARVWDYIRAGQLDYNPLHDRNYPSIGCTHCTRPVAIGEDPRAGRWSSFAKTECGLHARG